MLKTIYETEIQNHLHEVFEDGFSRVKWSQLLRWSGTKRTTDFIWDELEERWNEIVEEDNSGAWRLGSLVWEGGNILTLVCLDPDGTDPEDASYQPLSSRKKKA
jgi:hypothetical protein